jgi:hypothetical protein
VMRWQPRPFACTVRFFCSHAVSPLQIPVVIVLQEETDKLLRKREEGLRSIKHSFADSFSLVFRQSFLLLASAWDVRQRIYTIIPKWDAHGGNTSK